jgi:hypothetical protein
MESRTAVALPDGMPFVEIRPVAALVWREDPCSLTEGAERIEGREDRRSDKLRTIRYATYFFRQGGVDLEANYFILGLVHV